MLSNRVYGQFQLEHHSAESGLRVRMQASCKLYLIIKSDLGKIIDAVRRNL